MTVREAAPGKTARTRSRDQGRGRSDATNTVATRGRETLKNTSTARGARRSRTVSRTGVAGLNGFARDALGAGNDAREGTDDVTALTVGLNWYLNDFTKVQFNYQRVWFDDRIDDGGDSRLRHVKKNEDVFYIRFAIDF